MIRDAHLDDDDFAVFTSDKELNQKGRCVPGEARVLFTTHSMVESRCEGRTFAEVSELHYRGSQRRVRIWDEAVLPGVGVTLSHYDIAALPRTLSRCHPGLAAGLNALQIKLQAAKDGTQVKLPDLARHHDLALQEAQQAAPEDQKEIISTLWFLFGKVVTVRKDDARGNTVLDYRETLPHDIAPLLVLDASARVRSTYKLWEVHRGGISWLPEAAKDYSPLTIHVWPRGGGKDSFNKRGAVLFEGIANTIDSKPAEDFVVVHHKGIALDVEQGIRSLLKPRQGEVHFLNWGAHDATNAFAHIPNIILAGTLFYPPSYYEAIGRAAAGHPSSAGCFPKSSFNEVTLGEHRHLILQALCRGAVRKCEGAACPKVNAYIIASNRSGILRELETIFPGVRILPWQPVRRELSGNAGKAAEFIIAALTNGAASVRFSAVMKHLGMINRANFNRTIRKHKDFRTALEEYGIVEWGDGAFPSCFRRAVDVYFPADEDVTAA